MVQPSGVAEPLGASVRPAIPVGRPADRILGECVWLFSHVRDVLHVVTEGWPSNCQSPIERTCHRVVYQV